MQSQVAEPSAALAVTEAVAATRGLTTATVERLTSAIVWLSYCGLISTAITIMGW